MSGFGFDLFDVIVVLIVCITIQAVVHSIARSVVDVRHGRKPVEEKEEANGE